MTSFSEDKPFHFLLVTGGRKYDDWVRVDRVLRGYEERYGGLLTIVQGGAEGADKMAAQWATKRGIAHVEMRAAWDKYGPPAGPIRNRWMLRLPINEVLAFPGGTGTANMVDQATKRGILVTYG